MYAITCSGCGERRLVFGSQITDVTNGAGPDGGIVVGYDCWCGTHGTIHTGRARRTVAA